MANPKLDFFRFKLKHKSGANKTFREFMLESGNVQAEILTQEYSVNYSNIL